MNILTRPYTREELITMIEAKLAKAPTGPDQMFTVCSKGLLDTLRELQKSALPDVLPIEIADRIQAKFDQPRVHRLDVDYFFALLRDELSPKPKTKTIWHVEWGDGGETRYDTAEQLAAGIKARSDMRKVLITKLEVPDGH